MRGAVLALVLTLSAGAVCADPADDAATLRACLAGSGSGSAAEAALACDRAVAAPCIDASGQTTLEIAGCLAREHAAWDVLLNAWWKPMMAAARDDGSGDALRTAQRAWIAFRDAECAWRHDRWGGGSIRTIDATDCRRELTMTRALAFRGELGDAAR